ncbi:head-tail adaptor protein [Rhizobium sp. DKSPLA3]|uniref:Head-tail adaptor protein n=1 Tax=Rhizobium quercicola TaxID=2901226 RepID=A0A9X1NTH9_9HYPH|nr:head-tail adaptor protein [Rhizobium quercicola]MCD7109711.1 head-tail adaptor protein [Rhizobium quercicola]
MAQKPKSGAMRERLDFQTRSVVLDDYGNEQGGWETVFTEPAQLVARAGGEAVQASRLTGVQPYTVWVRSNERTRSVTSDWRIVDARNPAREFNIRTASNPDGRNAWIEFMVDDGVAT